MQDGTFHNGGDGGSVPCKMCSRFTFHWPMQLQRTRPYAIARATYPSTSRQQMSLDLIGMGVHADMSCTPSLTSGMGTL